MSEQENMDDLIRSKFSEMDFPFDEENWAKAEEMIVAARAKEKRRRWGILFFFGILLGVLVMLPFVWNNKGAEKINTALAENKNTTVESITENKENQSTIASETKSPESESSVETKETTENEKAESTKENTAVKEEVKESAKKADKITKEETASSAVSASTESKSIPVKTKKPVKPTLPVNTTASAAPVNENKTEIVRPAKKETEKTEAPMKVTTVKERKKEADVIIPKTKKEESQPKQETKKEVSPVATIVPEPKKKEEVVKQETKKDVSTATTKSEETKNNSSNTITPLPVASSDSAKQQPVVTKKDSAIVKPAVVKKDSVPPVVKQTETKKDSSQKTKSSWTISLDGGINAFLSGGSGISPIVGISITKVLSEKWEIGSGVYYTYIPTFSGVSTFTTDATYDFGSTFTLTEITTTKLHYVTAPLFVKYNLNEKNAMVFGANFYYLFNSSNIVTTYDISYTGIGNKVSKKANGYYNGFSPYDVGIIAGYRKNIFEKLGVALYANYGLMNLQKSGTTSSNNIHNNISGQLMLTYKLFK